MKRHVTTLVKLLSPKLSVENKNIPKELDEDSITSRPHRNAAKICANKNRKLFEDAAA